MRVVICEDEKSQLQMIHNVIKNYSSFHLPDVEIVLCTTKPEEVLEFIERSGADCYFFDIELNSGMDGLKLAQTIREKDPLASIIFVTSYAEKLRLTFKYKVAALDFIVKDSDGEKFKNNIIDALKTAYKRYLALGQNDESRIFQIKVGENIRNIRMDDIYYFETSLKAHKIRVYTKIGNYEFYGNLRDLEKLDNRFCRIHNSYLININYFDEYDSKNRILKLKNGYECLVSYRYFKNLKKHLN